MASRKIRKSLAAALTLFVVTAPALLGAPGAVDDRLSACHPQTVVDVLANDSIPGGRELAVRLLSGGGCPGVIRDLGGGLFEVGGALGGQESCTFTYDISDGGDPISAEVTLECSDGTAPPTLTPLDERRREALEAVNTRRRLGPQVTQVETSPGVFVQVPQPNLTLAGEIWSRERAYWEKILTLLGLHELGVLDDGAVESARRLMRFQFAVLPGDNVDNLDKPPFELNTRTTAMRVYYLYRDLLFPNAGEANDPNHDLSSVFAARILSGSGHPVLECVPGQSGCFATENHMTTRNSFHVLADQLAGLPADDSNVAAHRDWWLTFLSHAIEEGFNEWGSGYFHWTLQAIINLADFAEDPEVRRMATLALDYQLALMAEQSAPGGNVASAGLRTYPWEILGNVTQYSTHIAHTLFTGGDLRATEGFDTRSVDFMVSNYRPLELVRDAFLDLPTNATTRITQHGRYRGSTSPWYHHNFRGTHYSLSANISPKRNYYSPHDGVMALLKTDRDPVSHVVPIGYHPSTIDRYKRRDTTGHSERGFGYRNVVIYTHGGVRTGCPGSSSAADCNPPNQPPRLYLTDDFNQPGLGPQLENGWAFLRNGDGDGATYVAWRPAVGSPIRDPENHTNLHFVYGGAFLRSSHTSTGPEGITCVLEVGDSASFGSYQNFKSSVRARNPGFGGRYYNALDANGNTIQIDYEPTSGNAYRYRVGSQDVTPDAGYPRVDGPRLDGTTLTVGGRSVVFNLDSLNISGHTDRIASGFAFGEGPVDPPEPLDISGLGPVTVTEGGTAIFSVTVTGGSGPITYAWQGSPNGSQWGALTETPPFSGIDSSRLTISPVPASFDGNFFRVVVSDDNGSIPTSGARLTVLPAAGCDPPPTAGNDHFTMPADGMLTIDMVTQLFGNDTVPNPEWAGFHAPAAQHGTPTPRVGNRLTYIPDPGYVGEDSFGYTVRSQDDPSCEAHGVVTVNVEEATECPAVAENDGPFAVPYNGTWSTAFWGAVLGNDRPPGDLSLPEITRMPAGTLTIGATGPVYRPPADYQPTDSFEYTVYSGGDPAGCTSQPATVSFNIVPPETVPRFTRSCTGLRCTFDASGSTGEGLSFSWDFGDNTNATGARVVHDFAAATRYQVTLTVTDAIDRPFTLTQATEPVLARDDGISVVFGTTLTQPLADLLANDLGPSPRFRRIDAPPGHGQLTVQAPTFSYTPEVCAPTSFRYEMTSADALYSRDVGGVAVTVLPDQPPQADFLAECDGLTCHFTDRSTDDSGFTIVGWNFGDGEGAGGAPSVTHTYPADGVYSVTLTVADGCSQTATRNRNVQVTTLRASAVSPAEAMAVPDGALRLSTTARGGVAPYAYRWQRRDAASEGWSGLFNTATYSGAFGPTLTISGSGPSVAGWYRCRVLDSAEPKARVFAETAAVYIEEGGVDPVIGEVGTVTVGDMPQTVLLGRSYLRPVVFAQPPSALDSDTAVVRVRSVDGDRFTLALEEAPDRDGVNAGEEVSYLVLEVGDWLLPDGRRLAVGAVDTAATVGVAGASWQPMVFASSFAEPPAVITQVQSDRDPSWVKTRQTDTTATGFRVAMEREEAANQPHGAEVIAYLAIEPGAGSWSGHPFAAGQTTPQISQAWRSISWSEDLGPAPHFLGALATYLGGDASALRLRHLGGSSVEVRVEEDTTQDSETLHTHEAVSYLAIGRAGYVQGSSNDLRVIAPTDLVVAEGQAAGFTVTATGGVMPYAYRWQHSATGPSSGFSDLTDGGGYAGTGTATLTLAPAASAHGGWYRCRISDAATPAAVVDSAPAELAVVPALGISSPLPVLATLTQGSSASFDVNATGGGGSYSYRWQHSVTGPSSGFSDLTDGGGLGGTGSPTLTLSQAEAGHAGWYRCRVESAGLTAVSTASRLEVLGSNLAPDPGFEADTHWIRATAEFPATGFYRNRWGTGGPHSGDFGHAISNLAYGYLLSEPFPLAPTTEYDLHAWMRGEVDGEVSRQSWSIRLLCYDDSGALVGFKASANGGFGPVGPQASDWVRQGGRLETQAGCATGRVQLTFLEASGWVAFDEVTVVAAAGGPNLVADSGFEQGDGWSEQGHHSFPATSLVRQVSGLGGPYAGSWGYSLNNLAFGNVNSEQIPASPLTEYDLHAWVRGQVDGDASQSSWSLRLVFYDAAGGRLGAAKAHNGAFGSPGSTPTEWVRRGGSVTTPAGTAAVSIQLRLREASGWIAFDDLTLVKAGTEQNLAPDPGFEIGSWTGVANADHPATSLYRKSWGIATPRSGAFGRAISNLAHGSLTSPHLDVDPEAVYTLNAWIRGAVDGDASHGSAAVRALCYDAAGTYLGVRSVFTGSSGPIGSSQTEWVHRGGRFTTCPGAASVRLELRLVEATGWVGYDDVTLQRLR